MLLVETFLLSFKPLFQELKIGVVRALILNLSSTHFNIPPPFTIHLITITRFLGYTMQHNSLMWYLSLLPLISHQTADEEFWVAMNEMLRTYIPCFCFLMVHSFTTSVILGRRSFNAYSTLTAVLKAKIPFPHTILVYTIQSVYDIMIQTVLGWVGVSFCGVVGAHTINLGSCLRWCKIQM